MKYLIIFLMSTKLYAGLAEDNLNLCLDVTAELQEIIAEVPNRSEVGKKVQIARVRQKCYDIYTNSVQIHKNRKGCKQ